MSKVTNLPQIDIALENGDWPSEVALEGMVKSAVSAAAEAASLTWPSGAELSLLFTSDAKMAEINGQWRDKPVPTNVLSFPGSDVAVGQAAGRTIGDMVFAYETLQREAEQQGKTFEDHFRHLVIHGFLHLFGYDHMNENEAGEMEALEIKALASLGIDNPYA